MSSDNLYKRLLSLMPQSPILTGQIAETYGDDTARVVLPGDGQLRVRNPQGFVQGAQVYVQDSAVIGPAPQLPYVLIEI